MFFLAYHNQKIALLRKERNAFQIEHLRTLGQDTVPLDALQPFLNKKKKLRLVTGLDAQQILLRSFSLKLKSKREIRQALPFQIENLFPHGNEELIALPSLFPEKDSTKVLLFATTKTHRQNHLEQLAHYGLDPDVISCTPLALYRFCRHFFPKYTSTFIQLTEGSLTTLIAIEEGRFVTSKSHKTDDCARAWVFLEKKHPTISHCLHFGGPLPPATLTLVEMSNPNLSEYAVAIGLALDVGKPDELSCQFRLSSRSKKEGRQERAFRFRFALICMLCTGVILGWGQLHLKKEEYAIVEELRLEKGTRLKKGVEELETQVYRQHKSRMELSPLPKVSDLLHWLSTHPALDTNCSIEQFEYEITKRPKLGSKLQAYGAKVTFTLEADPASSRKFHEALLKASILIDQKQGVKWQGDEGRYQVSFHVKVQAAQ